MADRFIVQKEDSGSFGFGTGTKIIVDKETGVQYLFVTSGYAGGLTLLVGRDGKPLLAKNYHE